MKKQQKEIKNEFKSRAFEDVRKNMVPSMEADFSKQLGARVVFDKFMKEMGGYFMLFKTSIPGPNNKILIRMKNFNPEVPQIPTPAHQGTGESFLKQIEALNFSDPELNPEFWKYTREKGIPMLEESMSSQLNTKFTFIAIINENDIPKILMKDEKTGLVWRWKIRDVQGNIAECLHLGEQSTLN